MSKKELRFFSSRLKEEFARMQSIYDLSKKVTNDNAANFMTKARSVTSMRATFRGLLDEEQKLKMDMDTEDTYEPDFSRMEAFDHLADVVLTVLQNLEDQVAAARAPKPPAKAIEYVPTVKPEQKIKLPRLVIPTFDGRIENWQAFYQSFDKLIHQNEDLGPLEKVNYLVSHLDSNAKSICAGITATAENYETLYKTLVDRYQDPRSLATYYMDKLVNFKPLVKQSEKDLNNFLVNFIEPALALRELNVREFFDFVVVYFAVKKLDGDTCRGFEHEVRSENLPKFKSLESYIRSEVKIVARQSSKPPTGSTGKTHTFVAQDSGPTPPPTPSPPKRRDRSCIACKNKNDHALYRCPTFKEMTPYKRFELVKKNRLCYNCFQGHFTRLCTNEGRCRTCSSNHHSMLHYIDGGGSTSGAEAVSEGCTTSPIPQASSASEIKEVATVDSNSDTPRTASYVSNNSRNSMILLSTARVVVFDSNGEAQVLRCLLDSGSQSCFAGREVIRRLGLKAKPADLVVDCLGKSSTQCREKIALKIFSRIRPEISFDIDAFILDSITDELPTQPVSLDGLTHLEGLDLADEKFNEPGPIDLLLSAAIWPHIIRSQKRIGPPGTPTALDSSLGWIVMGDYVVDGGKNRSTNMLAVAETLDSLLERFWAIEEIPGSEVFNQDDETCEKFFLETVERTEEGRFMVSLPFKQSCDLLGDSLEAAKQRFLALERRFSRDPEFYQHYVKVMDSHIADGYISPVAKERFAADAPAYYVPHHPVLKPGSTSTPLRIVWNMSASTTSGYSLNDLVHVGPKLQSDLFNILLNFRLFSVAISSDVRQMFLRVLVAPEHRKFQRLLWRSNPRGPLTVMEINTLVFGLSTSPYLAQRCLRYLAELEASRFPLAARVVRRDVYMDDVATSVPTEDEAKALYSQLVSLFEAGSFTLAKWCTSSPELLEQIPQAHRLNEAVCFEDIESSTKILGLRWNPERDTFGFSLNPVETKCTKRLIYSAIARIFDPLGLLAPVIIVAKVLIRRLWQANVDWDDTPPTEIVHEWKTFVEALPSLDAVSIPRHSGIIPGSRSVLIGFCDASKEAYGAVVYIRTQPPDGGPPTVRMICAKSKVAPKLATTIPRLELYGALLLSKLLRSVIDTYSDRHTFHKIYACTDATVVLQWISSPASRWKMFVGNRVQKIQERIGVSHWRHVRGEDNPADCLSRGVIGKAFIEHDLWFSGPSWLTEDEENWPLLVASGVVGSPPPEEAKVVSLKITTPVEWILAPLLERVSSLRRLHRVTAWVFRFLRKSSHRVGPLQASELDHAEREWLLYVQKRHFSSIIHELEAHPRPSKRRPRRDPLILRLDLFLGGGLLRVGGRLGNSDLPYEQQHPVLLPKSEPYVTMLVDQWHQDHLHTGAFLLMSLIKTKFWIISGRDLVRQRVQKCNTCFHADPKPTHPKMASLPSIRLQQAKAFTNCGVDYAGPFRITIARRRGGKTQKAYLCLFVCLVTKALHLELASDLSTPCFLLAFKRFLSRRGPCSVIQSDQGTNFVGARSILHELYSLTCSREFTTAIEDELSNRRIEWRLNPPAAPHFGGVWESQVKCVKTHLARVVGNQILTFEEMTTVLCQIEALLNSRPLCAMGEDPHAPSALTPAHFLTLGSTLGHLPAQDVSSLQLNRLDHHQRVDWIVQHYWQRWSREYLHTLQQRAKWVNDEPAVEVGNVVLVMNEKTSPLEWPLAIIEEIYPATDGTVRVARVRTRNGVLVRPVVKLCVLPTQ